MPGSAPAASVRAAARPAAQPGAAWARPGAGRRRAGAGVAVALAAGAPGRLRQRWSWPRWRCASSTRAPCSGWPACTGPRYRQAAQLPPGLGQRLLAVAVVAPLPLAARYPDAGLADRVARAAAGPAGPGCLVGRLAVGPAPDPRLLAAFCLAGIRQPRPELWWMWALSLIPWWLWLAADMPDLNGPASATVVFTAAAIAVDSIGSRLRAQRALAAQTERAEMERARRAVLEERTRIARELHDVVAHHMSLIAVRAETAPYRLPGLPEPVRAEFGCAERGGPRGAGGDAAAARRAAPRPARRAGAAAPARRPARRSSTPPGEAGVPVELSVPPALGQVPAGVGVCAYRIVQESLSNASQHAPGAAVTVSVDHDAGAVLLRVANGPGRPAGPPRRARARSRADRDARAGGAARRLAVGRPGARRRLRGVGGAPARRDGMTAGAAPRGRRDHPVPDRRRPGDGAGGLRRGARRPARPGSWWARPPTAPTRSARRGSCGPTWS